VIKATLSTLPEGRTLWEPSTALATFFGTGLLPIAPGTWASAVALPIGWVIASIGGCGREPRKSVCADCSATSSKRPSYFA